MPDGVTCLFLLGGERLRLPRLTLKPTMFPTPLTTRLVYTAFGFGATVYGIDLTTTLLGEPLVLGTGFAVGIPLLYLLYFWAAFGAYKGQAVWSGVLTLLALLGIGSAVAMWSTFLADPASVGATRLGLMSILGAASVAVLPRFAGTTWALVQMRGVPFAKRAASPAFAADVAEPSISPLVALGVVAAAVGAVVAFGASPLAHYALDNRLTSALGVLLLAMWVWAAIWSYRDARSRGIEPLPVALLVTLGGPIFGPWAWAAERRKLARV